MSSSENRSDDGRSTDTQSSETARRGPPSGEGLAAWFAASTLRIGLAVVGFIVVLYALGRAAGVDLLGLFADALGTEVGRWLAVALFGLVLIVIALYSFDTPYW